VTATRDSTMKSGHGPIRGSSLSRGELLTMLSAIMALMALGIDMLLPAFDDIEGAFGLAPGETRVSQVITVFFLGLAVAQLFWGPLADRYGRKKILYAGMVIYGLGAIGSALSTSFEMLLLSRFVWGVGAAGSRVVATAIIRDVFSGNAMAKAMSQIMAVFVLVPVFAPALGSGLIAFLPWRSIFWFCLVWAFGIALWGLRMPETLNPENQRPLEMRSVFGGFRQVLRHRLTSGYTMSTLFIQGVFTAYLGSSERIIDDIFDRGDQFPFIFGAVAILFGVGALINGWAVGIIGMHRLIRLVFISAFVTVGALVAISLAADGEPNFWIFMPLLGVLLAHFMFLMPNLNTAALEPMGSIAGTASSLTGAARIAGGALLGALVDSQVSDSVTPFVIAAAIFIVLAGVSAALAGGLSLSAPGVQDSLAENLD